MSFNQFKALVDMLGNKIVNLGTPTAQTDAATKGYVDGLRPSITLHQIAPQAVAANADVLINFGSAYNTGPASWWSSAQPSRVIMPYVGAYLMTAYVGFPISNAGTRRAAHLLKGPLSEGIFISGFSVEPDLVEPSTSLRWADVIIVDTIGQLIQLTAWHDIGSGISTYQLFDYPRASLSFTYLG